ncbi:MAG: S-methyl-5'-thioadenosine phosphorylase [Rhodospirillaceae bacterium]|nr:S-methyl-5'-thioadenosine phosphorylase [Rhodospirillaceae bacterium]
MNGTASAPVIGIIGGSGVYDIEGLTGAQWIGVETPFGAPSDELLVGALDGQKVVFLPRHGRGHTHSPTTVNYRANIYALKVAGVTDIISLSACGSFRENLPPGTFVIIDQIIDRTYSREKSFFGDGLVAHVSLSRPVCARVGDHVEAAAKEAGLKHHRRGTYLAIEGPQFSTQAESYMYRAWGCDVIGMTNMPEAKLAREAEMCYATVAMVTDFDCWHPDHDAVTVDQVVRTLIANAVNAKTLVKALVPRLSLRAHMCTQGCHTALDHAMITAKGVRDKGMLAKLRPIVSRFLATSA